jgi:hypothetical protein
VKELVTNNFDPEFVVNGDDDVYRRSPIVSQMITVNDEFGDVCCVGANPHHFCPRCKSKALKGKHMSRNATTEPDDLIPGRLDHSGRIPVGNFDGQRPASLVANGVTDDPDSLLPPRLAFNSPPGRPGGDTLSYPRSGVVDPMTGEPIYQASTADARADRQHDPGAVVMRGSEPAYGQGARGREARPSYYPTSGPAAQYDAPMEHEDRTDGMRGVFHTAGSPFGSVSAADFFAGGRPLPTEKYAVTQADRDAENRRVCGSQGAPTTNQDDLIPGKIDLVQQAASWPKMPRPQ